MKHAGFIKLMRSSQTKELICNHVWAFILLAQIALRARYRQADLADWLQLGEALVGDFKTVGLTRQRYRTALRRLELMGFITVRATNRGSIVKLVNSEIFDINLPRLTSKLTSPQPPTTGITTSDTEKAASQVTTKEESIKERKNGVKEAEAIAFRPQVTMTQEEYSQLLSELGQQQLNYWLDELASSAQIKPTAWKKYKCHFRVLLNWRKRKLEDGFVWDESICGYRRPSKFGTNNTSQTMKALREVLTEEVIP